VEARGRPALVPGESPASVITSSPILSNSGRTPLVLLVLHLLSHAHLASPAFQPLLSSSSVSSSFSVLYRFRKRFLSFPLSLFLRVILRFYSARNSSSFVSYLFYNFFRTLSSDLYCSCKKLYHSQTMNKKIECVSSILNTILFLKWTNYRFDSNYEKMLRKCDL